MSFADRLLHARSLRGLSQASLAAEMGFRRRSSVCQYEKGITSPTVATVERFAEILRVDAVWLSGLPGSGEGPRKGVT